MTNRCAKPAPLDYRQEAVASAGPPEAFRVQVLTMPAYIPLKRVSADEAHKIDLAIETHAAELSQRLALPGDAQLPAVIMTNPTPMLGQFTKSSSSIGIFVAPITNGFAFRAFAHLRPTSSQRHTMEFGLSCGKLNFQAGQGLFGEWCSPRIYFDLGGIISEIFERFPVGLIGLAVLGLLTEDEFDTSFNNDGDRNDIVFRLLVGRPNSRKPETIYLLWDNGLPVLRALAHPPANGPCGRVL